MIFQLHIPAFPLGQFVASFIYYKGYNPQHSIDRFLPDGNVNIIIDLTEGTQYIYHNETLKEIQACRRVWFSGIRTRYITIPSGKHSEMFIINFHKGASYPFVEMPLYELTDSVVDGDLVLTPEIMLLREMIMEQEDITDKFLKAESFLGRRFTTKLVVNPFVDYAVKTITAQPGILSIKNIARKAGYSQKHLIQIFKNHVGVTPKEYMKVIRFQKAIQEIEQAKKISWAGIALECGYYDQAHFINDFKQFSGFTPKEYLNRQGEFLNYIPVE